MDLFLAVLTFNLTYQVFPARTPSERLLMTLSDDISVRLTVDAKGVESDMLII
jgi:hypothetical protein